MVKLAAKAAPSLIAKAVEAQRDYFASGATAPVEFRLLQLRKLKSALEKFQPQLEAALFADLHKSSSEAFLTEFYPCFEELKFFEKNLKNLARPRKVPSPILFPLSSCSIHSKPRGVALILSPWNYPVNLTIMPLIGAIAAGNCAIIKPSSSSSSTSKVLAKMLASCFDEKFVLVVQGDSKAAEALLDYQFDYIFFTGSPAVGKSVMAAASKHLTPLTLELGGKSPCIIDKGCDVEKAASRIVWGKFTNAGQTCIAPDYVLVHKAVEVELIAALARKITDFFGPESQKATDYCRIINQKHFERLCGYLKEGKVVFGGIANPKEKYLSPTLLVDILPGAKVMGEEIFGPILPVIPVSSMDEAIAFVNKKPKPLALYVFSNLNKTVENVLFSTSSGGACVNDVLLHVSTSELPFGGVGSSGFGKYHGKASFEAFSNARSVFSQTNLFDLRQRYPPYDKKFIGFVKRFGKI
ncbi:MAG: aldehyde dehydrogenase family protein [Candidatus Micrarchaeia archaeon]|jgi:aldehyde dehydrogenase (NAD+)